MKKITGISTYVSLEGGFWGIKSQDTNYLPMEMPEQLKSEGQDVVCTLELLDVMTLQNWGIPCKIISFSTSWT